MIYFSTNTKINLLYHAGYWRNRKKNSKRTRFFFVNWCIWINLQMLFTITLNHVPICPKTALLMFPVLSPSNTYNICITSNHVKDKGFFPVQNGEVWQKLTNDKSFWEPFEIHYHLYSGKCNKLFFCCTTTIKWHILCIS